MLKIFTRKGDKGTTDLASGERVIKCSELVELYGNLDELNAFIGWSVEAVQSDTYQVVEARYLLQQLYNIQRQLFALGQQLTAKQPTITEEHIKQLEIEIENVNAKLPVLKSFVLPGGGEAASRLHVVRTVCRRAERAAFRAVAAKHKNAEIVGVYLNRLGDWFFLAARYAAFIANVEEAVV